MAGNAERREVIDHAAARLNARRTVMFTVALMTAAAVAGVTVALLLPPAHHGHHHRAAGLIVAAAMVVLIGLSIPMLLRLYRRPNYARVLQYGWVRRRRVSKALRKGRPIALEDRPVADALVITLRRQRWLPWLFGGLIVLNIPRAVFDHGSQRVFGIALLGIYAVLAPLAIRQRRSMLTNYDRLTTQSDPPPTT